MRFQVRLVAVLFALLLSLLPHASSRSVPQLAEKALAATVSLEVQDENGVTLGQGSGFFVRPNLIATNFHVIDGAAKGIARLVNKGTAYPIEGLVGADEINDLALLRVTIHGVIPLSLGDSDKVQTGQTVYVAGNPLGFDGTFSDGIVSSRRNTYGIERLQMTAPISPGSSGGPVLNTSGEVIGVSVSTFSPLFGQNLNFAIPSNSLKALLTRSRQAKPMLYSKQTTSADTFRQRGWEKIRLGDYNGALVDFANAIRLSPDNPVLYAMRGHAKHSLGQYTSAVDDYNTAIRLNPNYATAYVRCVGRKEKTQSN